MFKCARQAGTERRLSTSDHVGECLSWKVIDSVRCGSSKAHALEEHEYAEEEKKMSVDSHMKMEIKRCV